MQDGKKHRLSQLMVNELLDDIDSQFKDMSVLQKEGKKQEAEVMWADLKCMLSNYRHDFSFEKNRHENFVKTCLPASGCILAENEKIILRAFSDRDYDDYMGVAYECSCMKYAFKRILKNF